MQGKKSYLINIAIILLVGGISLYLSVGKELGPVLHTVLSANPLWMIILFALMIGYYLIDGLALWYFGAYYKKDYTYKQSFINAIIGTLFNGITPSSSGGQFAQVYVFNNQGIPPAIATGILLMSFISYQLVLIGFTAIIMILQSGYFLHEGATVTSMALIGFLINFIITAFLFFGAKSHKFQSFVINVIIKGLYKMHIIKDFEATSFKASHYFHDFRKQMKLLQSNKDLLKKASLCNVGKLLIMYSTPFFACMALHIPVSPMQFLTFLGLTSIINLINTFLPIPGASGGSEGCYMILFGFLGRINASSSMFLWRFFSFYLGVILGAIVFATAKDVQRKSSSQD